MNQNNNNDVYHDDNSFNNQGMDMPQEQPTTGEALGNMANSGMNFAKGINNMKNNPALGLKKPKEKSKELDKKDGNNKNNQNNDDPTKGQKKDNNNNNNQMPGAKRNQDNKKPNNQNDTNNKKKSGDNNIANKNKQGGMFSRFNPMNKTSKGKTGGTKKAAGVESPNLNQMAKKGLRAAWVAAPIPEKLIVIGVAILPILILAFIALLSIFGATVAATTAAMCGSDSFGSSYNGEDYAGSADVKEFMCKMQNPLADPSLYLNYDNFGEDRGDHMHAGIDLASWGYKNIPIYAAQAGTIESSSQSGYNGGMGTYVKIKHGDSGIQTVYMHMVSGSLKVKTGDKVGKGQLIGKMGTTGRSGGVHLHFEIRSNGKPQNPGPYFKKNFKEQCGASWDGELAGDSANAVNDTTDYVSSGLASNADCCDTSGSTTSSDYCPNGITVTGDYAGTYNLDEYIAKVVTRENGGANDEALKALAIAARTYALNRTDNCEKSIVNSTAAQVMAKEASEHVKEVVSEVNGSVMLYKGKVFSAQYSSFWGSCSGNTCTGKFKKSPTDEWGETYTMPKSYYTLMGHQNGLSQNGSNYMASQGKKYDEILKYFYVDGIEITNSTNSCVLGKASFSGEIIPYYQFNYGRSKCGASIARSGCGPTSMAIVAASLRNDKSITPVETANFGCDSGEFSSRGANHAFFDKAIKKYNLTGKWVSKENADEVLTALSSGRSLVIAHMGPSTFTSGGHYIVLVGYDGEKVKVQDPASKSRTKKKWNFDLIKREAKTATPFFIVSN